MSDAKPKVLNITISHVSEFNSENIELYHKHRLDKRRKYVMLNEYVILTKHLTPRKKGYVFTINDEAVFNINRKEFIKILNEKLENL
jgi:hypothetical protein